MAREYMKVIRTISIILIGIAMSVAKLKQRGNNMWLSGAEVGILIILLVMIYFVLVWALDLFN